MHTVVAPNGKISVVRQLMDRRLFWSSIAAFYWGFPKSLTSWREACGTVSRKRYLLHSVIWNGYKKHTRKEHCKIYWLYSKYLFESERPSFCYIVSVFTSKNSTVTAIFLLRYILQDIHNISSLISQWRRRCWNVISFISVWLTVALKLPTVHLMASSSLPFFALCSSFR